MPVFLFAPAGTRLNRRVGANLALMSSISLFVFYVTKQLTAGILEPKFVNDNEVLGHLAEKYHFTIFDFAIAKKESHLKAMQLEFINQSHKFTYWVAWFYTL